MQRTAIQRARDSLLGLSVGDAFGERFFVSAATVVQLIEQRATPRPLWRWTDDTAMAIAICETLFRDASIDPDVLAAAFARRYVYEPMRGYGRGAHELLQGIAAGGHWSDLAPALFGGTGSYGNGGAMRVAPIGAYFGQDPERAASQARLSALPTHAHPEGVAGAIAVAVATAWLVSHQQFDRDAFFAAVCDHTPRSETRDGIQAAYELRDATVPEAAAALGTGQRVSSQDTVPFTLWCVAVEPDDYEQALWVTVAGLGDRDTTCAIVGGMVAARRGAGCIPPKWLRACEALPESIRP